MAFVTAIGDIFSFVTAIADTNVGNGCDNGAVTTTQPSSSHFFTTKVMKFAKLVCGSNIKN
jgi:hypothetical protein